MDLEPDRDDFAPVIMAASVAQIVRALELATFGGRVAERRDHRLDDRPHAPLGAGGKRRST